MLRHRRFYLVLSVPVVLMIGALVLFRSQPDEITISFVGDIMLSRGVQSYLEEFGYDYPYEDVRDLFLQDDLTEIWNAPSPIMKMPPTRQSAFCLKQMQRMHLL